MSKTITCAVCGVVVVAVQGNKQYCTHRCQQRAYRTRVKDRQSQAQNKVTRQDDKIDNR